MTIRYPLVMAGGQIERLRQVTDTLEVTTLRVPISGTDGGADVTGGLGIPEYVFTHEMIKNGVAGYTRYQNPVRSWFLDAASESTLEIDNGGGYVPLVYGVDYVNLVRGYGNPGAGVPPTVSDLGMGFRLLVPSVGTESYRFRWKERRILYDVPGIAKAFLDGSGQPDNTVRWNPSQGSASSPNGVIIPPIAPGYKVEFWRVPSHQGGKRGNTLARGGRGYVPYYRGAVDQLNFIRTEFVPVTGSISWRYKVCYYNPSTGARSFLSTDTIRAWKTNQNERCNGNSNGNLQRNAGSIWIE